MTNNKTYKFILLQLAVLIFVSASGFVLNLHYCGSEVQNFSLLGEAEACNLMEDGQVQKEVTSCMIPEKSSKQELQPENCCSTKTYKIDNNSIQKESEKVVKTNKTQLVATFLAVHNLVDIFFGSTTNNYPHYSPPALVKKRNLLFESFLI